jgi:hypothetical protein
MKRFLGLLFIALVVLVLILLVTRPELVQSVWLWLVGFIGYIVYFITSGTKNLLALFKKEPAAPSSQEPAKKAPKVPDSGNSKDPEKGQPATSLPLERLPETHPDEWQELGGTAVTVLRYLDDGNTTLGLLYVGSAFFCYTLEDSHRDKKVAGITRIPEGRYPLSLNANLTELTQRYRKRFPWFDYHIEIKDVPDFDLVYLHIGNSHRDTRGCLLLADGVNAGSPEKLVTHSQRAFERFYRTVYPTLTAQVPQEITIRNENWMERAGIRTKHFLPVTR